MKVTIIDRQDFDGDDLKQSVERVFYPKDINELSCIPCGFVAKRIRLEFIEFDKVDIPNLIKFLENSEPCFM